MYICQELVEKRNRSKRVHVRQLVSQPDMTQNECKCYMSTMCKKQLLTCQPQFIGKCAFLLMYLIHPTNRYNHTAWSQDCVCNELKEQLHQISSTLKALRSSPLTFSTLKPYSLQSLQSFRLSDHQIQTSPVGAWQAFVACNVLAVHKLLELQHSRHPLRHLQIFFLSL